VRIRFENIQYFSNAPYRFFSFFNVPHLKSLQHIFTDSVAHIIIKGCFFSQTAQYFVNKLTNSKPNILVPGLMYLKSSSAY